MEKKNVLYISAKLPTKSEYGGCVQLFFVSFLRDALQFPLANLDDLQLDFNQMESDLNKWDYDWKMYAYSNL